MLRHTSSSISHSNSARTLLALALATTFGCAGTVTPPDSTPVYAEEIAPGAEPVEVDMLSTNDPEPKPTDSSQVPTGDETQVQDAPAATRESPESHPPTDEAESTSNGPGEGDPGAEASE